MSEPKPQPSGELVRSQYSRPKVLHSNGYSIDSQATEILERGRNGFIQKPFNVSKLSQRMREILDKE